MNAGRTARDRARAELTQEIKATARRQLAVAGAAGLSLRAVARELGMVSSALYRYFPSRDDLLTALIIDAYDGLGAAAAAADAAIPRCDTRRRWRAACHVTRDWARHNPHEFALVYGSPVPGYRAPQDTIAAASRIALVLLGTVRDAWCDGTLAPTAADPPLPGQLSAQTDRITATLAPGVPAEVITRTLIAWTQLFGMISFELFGQFVGTIEPADEFFTHTVEKMADLIGFQRPPFGSE